MKILVFSDTHGDFKHMESAIAKHRNADIIVHCGDGEEQSRRAAQKYADKMVVRVRGNCDLGSQLPAVEYFTAFGKKIMVTHGHYYEVKYTLTQLYEAAREQCCDLVLFGHTHMALNEYRDGIYVFNPGSCAGWRPTYGVIEITEDGSVLANIAKA